MDGIVFIQFRLGHLIGEHCTMSQCRRCNFPIVNFRIRFFGLSPAPCPEYDINPCTRKWNSSDDLERTTRRRNVRRRTANCISCNICARECHKFCTRKTLANTSSLLANRDFGFHCLKIVSHNFHPLRCLRTSLCLSLSLSLGCCLMIPHGRMDSLSTSETHIILVRKFYGHYGYAKYMNGVVLALMRQLSYVHTIFAYNKFIISYILL